MKITTIGLDLAKNIFHVVCCNAQGKIVKKRQLRRSQVLYFLPVEFSFKDCTSSDHLGPLALISKVTHNYSGLAC